VSFQDIIMQFQCESTDGPAQKGILSTESYKLKTPTILFPKSSLYQTPHFAEGFIDVIDNTKKNGRNPIITVGNSIYFHQESTEKEVVEDFIIIPESLPQSVKKYFYQYDEQHHDQLIILPSDPDLINESILAKSSQILIVSNALQLFSNPLNYVKYITAIRKRCSYDSLLFLPSIANPSTLAVLCYSGADLFDATSAILTSRHHQFFLPDTTSSHVDSIHENPCVCPMCSQTEQLPSSFSFDQLLQHNYSMLYQELILIHHAIQQHHLRDLVEKRIRNAPELVTLLRYLDSTGYEYVEQRSSVSMPESYILQSTSREAGFRPEIKRFQQRVLDRYQKPSNKKILLLLPCSAKKPYSFSKSHQRFNQAISKVKNHSLIHEIIITSPLGLVPRELELTYPAASYDISVTGSWYEDEKQMIQEQLDHYLKNNCYEAIVSHLPKTLIHPSSNIETIWHSSLQDEKATSKNSLRKLSDILSTLTSPMEPDFLSKNDQKRMQIQAIATYQFGTKLADALTKNIIVKGKYPYLKFFDEKGQQLGMIPEGRGLISLTAEGGKRMDQFHDYRVTINTGFTVKGSILSPGVTIASKSIRKGDDVLVFQGDAYLGVGSALMNGIEMSQRSYGVAVNMRHKQKN